MLGLGKDLTELLCIGLLILAVFLSFGASHFIAYVVRGFREMVFGPPKSDEEQDFDERREN
jgi:hypothetical protein